MVDIQIKTKEQIRDDLLRTIRQGLLNLGIANPNVSEGTYDYLVCSAVGQEGALQYDGQLKATNACLPDTAQGEDLIRLAALKGLSLSPAGPSTGLINFTASITTQIGFVSGAQLIDPTGLTYFITIGGSFNATQKLNIQSTDTGESTNLAAGTTLRWVNPPPFVNQTATVAGPNGLTGGTNAEDIEDLRVRFLALEAGPPNNGENYTAVNLIAEQSSSAVQKAFSYPGVYGPGTAHVAVMRAPTLTSKNRDVDSSIMSTQVIPNVIGQLAEFTDVTVTTVTNILTDVSLGIEIPSSKLAIPAGPGGGWYDGTPFPVTPLLGFSAVSVISSTQMDVNSSVAPVEGGHVCYVSSTNWKIYHSVIVSFAFLGGITYRITLDKGFFKDDENNVVIQDGDWIFPDAVNMDTYILAVLEAFGSLGPGQKTEIIGLLPRGYRKPLVIISFPSDLTGKFLKTFQNNAGDEVVDVDYIKTIVGGNPNLTSPPLNTIYQEPPNILVPQNIAFYPI